jgi:hypothetical protein
VACPPGIVATVNHRRRAGADTGTVGYPFTASTAHRATTTGHITISADVAVTATPFTTVSRPSRKYDRTVRFDLV